MPRVLLIAFILIIASHYADNLCHFLAEMFRSKHFDLISVRQNFLLEIKGRGYEILEYGILLTNFHLPLRMMQRKCPEVFPFTVIYFKSYGFSR